MAIITLSTTTMYLFELPTTGAISFSDMCIDHTDSKIYTPHVSNATQARANLRNVLKEEKRTDGDKDYLKLLKTLEDYFPQLRGIMAAVAHDELGLRIEPVFSWRTTLSAHLFANSPRLDLPSLHAELASSLLTYAFALSNYGRATVKALGAYEYERAISDAERKAKDDKLGFAVTLLCRASGVFSHISDNVLQEWESSRQGGTAGFTRPPDLRRDVCSALAKLSIASAQSLAIRKLLSKSAYDSTIAPGPPLPKSHPSPALIAKLHLECVALYSSARALVKNSGSDVSQELRKYLGDELAFHTALSRKWLGVDCGEKGGSEQGGDAVGFLMWARKELVELKESRLSGLKGEKEKDGKARRKGRVNDELEVVNVFLKQYKKMNDSVHFRPVPSQSDLQARIPAGRLVSAAVPYNPSPPAFGPGSVHYIQRQAEELELADGEEGKESKDREGNGKDNYVGAGSYF